MTPQFPQLPHKQRLTGLSAALVLHLLVLAGWHIGRTPVSDTGAEPETIQWVNIKAPVRPMTPPPVHARTRGDAAEPAKPARAAAQKKPKPATIEPAPITPTASPAPAPASNDHAPSVDDIMQRARKDIGKIDKDLRKEFPGARIKAPRDSPQLRLERGIELANELAPPKWYEPAKIKEIIEPGQYGRRRYRIITSGGTHCVTYESNRSPDGRDIMQKGPQPKVTNCPQHEQPATTQQYED